MNVVRAPPFVLDHLPHDICWAGAVVVSSVNLFDGDFCCQTLPYKPRYCSPNRVSAIIFLFAWFAILFCLGELFGRFSAIGAELVLLREKQERARIVAQCYRRDLLFWGETLLVSLVPVSLVQSCQRHGSIGCLFSHKRPLYCPTIGPNVVVHNSSKLPILSTALAYCLH